MGWSDTEFWHSTPRKYYSVFLQHVELNKPPEKQVKSGDDAIQDILKTMGQFKQ